MKPILILVVAILCCLLSTGISGLQTEIPGNSNLEIGQESKTVSKFPAVENDRLKRSVKDDIDKGLKDFAEKVSKLPEKLNASLKKYFEERGISMESIQKILNEISAAVGKLVEEVKKAF